MNEGKKAYQLEGSRFLTYSCSYCILRYPRSMELMYCLWHTPARDSVQIGGLLERFKLQGSAHAPYAIESVAVSPADDTGAATAVVNFRNSSGGELGLDLRIGRTDAT